MTGHPETAFVPFVRDELAPAEHARVAAHVQTCAACARAVEETREVLARLGASLPVPPDVHWGAYRTQLRDRLQARRAARAGVRGWARRWAQPLPLAAYAVAAALLLVIATQREVPIGGPTAEAPAFEEVVIGTRLPLLEQYPVMERLDLLEDLDVIRQLDVLPVRDG